MSDAATRSTGLIEGFSTRDADFEVRFAQLETRREQERSEIDARVHEIIEDVRRRGDVAVIDATKRFDGYTLEPGALCVAPGDLGGEALSDRDRRALEVAAERVRTFHSAHVPKSWTTTETAGDRLGQLVRPLDSAALYAPAGTAPLASTILMLGIPASVAGVRDLVLATPAERPPAAMIAAAGLCGVERILRAGGAQAVAALALGTETIARADKIVGPGSVWVQAAKRALFGQVGIDSEAGPSEVAIVAEGGSSPELIAADLIAQAEHDELASVVLLTPCAELVAQTRAELARQLPGLPREAIARKALAQRSALVCTRDVAEAVELANRYGAEHLQLFLSDAETWLPRVRHAGAVFVGPHSPVPAGDYVAGPSHVLPTGGTARFFSVVGVEDFQKRMSLIELSAAGIRAIAPHGVALAELEGLEGHARSLRLRMSASSEED